MESGQEDPEQVPELSQGTGVMLTYAWESAQGSGKPTVELPHLIHAIFKLQESLSDSRFPDMQRIIFLLTA